jgi:hypothetical protein
MGKRASKRAGRRPAHRTVFRPVAENPFDGYRLAIVPGGKREDLLIEGECMAAANKRGAGWRVATVKVTLNPKRLVTLGKKRPS